MKNYFMEVHAHAHTLDNHREKKWYHYLWEFFMLFLAVFCGFLAENQREHFVEVKKTKQYAHLLINDLLTDTVVFQIQAERNERKEKRLDALMQLLEQPLLPNQYNDLYYYSRFLSEFIPFHPYDGTFQELKSSGSLRYFKDPYLEVNILRYYEEVTYLNNGYSGIVNENAMTLEVYKITSQILKEKYFSETLIKNNTGFTYNIKKPDSQSSLLSTDPVLLNQLASLASLEKYQSGFSRKYTTGTMTKFAVEIIVALRKEYHLE
jgi:hypothetical protein